MAKSKTPAGTDSGSKPKPSGGSRSRSGGRKPVGGQQASTTTGGTPAPYTPDAKSIKGVMSATGVDQATASRLLIMGNAAKHSHGIPDADVRNAILGKDPKTGKSNGEVMLTEMVFQKMKANPDTVKQMGDLAKLTGLTPDQLMEGQARDPGFVQSLLARQQQQAAAAAGTTVAEAVSAAKDTGDIAQTNVGRGSKQTPSTETDIGELPDEDADGDGAPERKGPDLTADHFAAMLAAAKQDHLATLKSIHLSAGSIKAEFGGKDVKAAGLSGDSATAAATPAPATAAPAPAGTQPSGTVQPSNANASRLDRSRNHAALNAMGFTDDDIRAMGDQQYSDTVGTLGSGFLDPKKPEFAQRNSQIDATVQQWAKDKKNEDWAKASWAPQAPPGFDYLKKYVGAPLSSAAKVVTRNSPAIIGGAILEEGILPMMTGDRVGGVIRYFARQRGQEQQQDPQATPAASQPMFSPVQEDPLPGFGPPPNYFPSPRINPAGPPPQR